MKSPHLYYIPALVVLLFLLYQKPGKEVIKVPAIVNELSPQPITYLEPSGETIKIIWRDRVIERKNPVNDSLLNAYKDLENKYQDKELELERAQMYIDAITIREFENIYEDEHLKLTLSGEVQGRLKWIKPTYEIKEREIEVKKRLGIDISIYAGYGLGNFGLSPQVGIGVSKPILRF